MSDVKSALAAKRAKLELLKKKREARRAAREQQKASAPATAAVASTSAPSENANDVLSSINAMLGSPPPSSGDSKSGITATKQVNVQLSTTEVASEDIEPQEIAKYDFAVQAGDPDMEIKQIEAEAAAEEQNKLSVEERMKKQKEEEEKNMEEQLRKQLAQDSEEANKLSAAQKKVLMGTKDFREFFSRSSVLVERALHQNDRFDMAINYAEQKSDDTMETKSVLMNSQSFYDPNRCLNRPVTAIDWSPVHKELVLCSYAPKEDTLSMEPDGLVLVWSAQMTNRPEYMFYCQSAVLTAMFHPSNSFLIVGGTQSGQVVTWDTREKRTPVNRTNLSKGHTLPVYGLSFLPSPVQTVNNIVSISTDGQLCIWDDNDLVEPKHKITLNHADQKDITTTCLAFPGRDTNTVVLGSDEGFVHKAHVHDEDGIFDSVEAHQAPITQVAFNPINKDPLFLTSSYDWTVRLWNFKTSRPLYQFTVAKDYVYDVQWSPTNPSLFAMADGTGEIYFWDLVKNAEVPIARANVFADEKSELERAIGRIKWSDDGRQLAVGTSDGALKVFDVSPSVAEPAENAAEKFYDAMRKQAIA